MQRMEWLARLDALVVFRNLLDTGLLRALRAALAAEECDLGGTVAAFEAVLFARGTNWTDALLDAVLEDENLCLRTAAGGDAGPVLEAALVSELDFLQALGRAGLDDLCHGAPEYLPRWQTDPEADYHAAYQARRAAVGRKGYGLFARYHVFTLEDGHLVPVRYPDPQRLSELPGYEREREITSSTTLREPTTTVMAVGTKEKPRTASTGTYRWPISGRITSYFGGRYIFGSYSYHSGLDISASYGATIKAADGGTVTFAGTKGSYGRLVIITHDNGTQTYYAHNSSLLVSAGDKVYQGQAIAKAGSTGRSTWVHCHFEMRVNGTAVNPLNYLD